MEKISTTLVAIIGMLIILLMFAATVLASAEVVWWVFTGEWFHIVSTAQATTVF